jgi:hypothetical protein
MLKSNQNIVAYCTKEDSFKHNRIFDRELAYKYPGALWVPELHDILVKNGYGVVTGDVAIHLVRTGKLNPTKILVIQEDLNPEGDELLHLGARGIILLCCESPLFAANFYELLPKYSRKFDHCVLFRGAHKYASPRLLAHVLHFPSYSREYKPIGKPWEKRKNIVMVTGNKYWKIRRSFARGVVAYIKDKALRRPKRFSSDNSLSQLHDQRLSIISYFGGTGQFDLYGNGWQSLRNLPKRWQDTLSEKISKMKPKPCKDKLKTISNYKFGFCIENIEYPGYVTEKIIDCLVAGVVPIYLGAPDIEDFIPEECFINLRRFESMAKVDFYLKSMPKQMWLELVEKGKIFLNTEEGRRYTYDAFVDRIKSMALGS